MRFGLTKKIRGSLAVRLAFLFSLMFICGIALAFFVAYFQMSYSLEKSLREVLIAKHLEASTLLSNGGVRGLKDFLSIENNRLTNASYMFRVLTSSGETVYLKPSVQDKAFDFEAEFKKHLRPEEFLGWQSFSAVNDEDKFETLTQKVQPAGPDLYLQVGQSNEDQQDVLDKILSVFGIVGGLFVFLSAGLGLWYSKRALKPVRDLLTTVHQIEEGDLSRRVELGDAKDELQDLSETFNRMMARIEKLVQVMKESLDNVAHDIRTPLTRIRAVAEDALLSGDAEAVTEALGDCAESATNISELVDQLLSISEAEAGTLSLKYTSCKVKDLLENVVDVYEFIAQEKLTQIEVVLTDESLVWNLDQKRIKQVIGNLLDNALKFSPSNTVIRISANVIAQKLQIEVADQGVGIPEAELKNIWDRLFRGDKSRTTEGSGLGLAIVKSIIGAHGGSIEVSSDFGHGSVFTVTLPNNN